MPDIKTDPSNASEPAATPFAEPYQRHLAEFQALTLGEVGTPNLDIASVVTTVLGAVPEILAFSPQISDQLPRFDLSRVRNLASYARALSHANTLYLLATQPADSLEPLLEEGTRLRDTLLADANALIQRGLLNGNRLKELRGYAGHKNLAVDLQLLTTLFRESFAQIEGRCGITRAELDRAEILADQVLQTVGLREQGTALIAASTDVRARAFTTLLGVYDEARRAISYLRWREDDVDTIAPSLYAGRGTGRKKAASDIKDPPKPPTATPGAPAETAPNSNTSNPTARAAQHPSTKPAEGNDPFLA